MPLSPVVQQMLENVTRPLPLTREKLTPTGTIANEDAARLFPKAADRVAAMAGLALQLGEWESAHSFAQDSQSREGSYWHAIIHRMEPDYWNAGG